MILKDEFVDLRTPSGPMRTHVFRPQGGGKHPGVVLFSEIFQVTGPIRRTAAFLAGHGLTRKDVKHWVAHTGGPKVLQAFEDALELTPGMLEHSWASLREVGNLSSASVLFVLGDMLEAGTARPGDWGVLMAMGPGFCSELVLLRW